MGVLRKGYPSDKQYLECPVTQKAKIIRTRQCGGAHGLDSRGVIGKAVIVLINCAIKDHKRQI